MDDTIAAIVTGVFNAPVAIIKISGPQAFAIVQKIFKGPIGQHQTITWGLVYDQQQLVDEVLVSWFVAPATFTGQDIAEINVHGGAVNTRRILGLLLASGARMAQRGEFSRRAFINGKMDLIKAEAIHDLIFAKTEDQASLAVQKFAGNTSQLISKLSDQLMRLIATIETNIDYPEYDDIEQLTNQKVKPQLEAVKKQLDEIMNLAKASQHIYDGVKVAIVGLPNVGKSSLFNALLNQDKAIVSNLPGTTRDVVEGELQVGQVLLKLKDTAGIHGTEHQIEAIGIEKSLAAIAGGDLIIHVVDATTGWMAEDDLIKNHAQGKPYLQIFNKADLATQTGINISAQNRDLDQLLSAIKQQYDVIDLQHKDVINNARQLGLIAKSSQAITMALAALEQQFHPDEVILDIRNAWKNLANVLGQGTDEHLLDQMFKNFCLGK